MLRVVLDANVFVSGAIHPGGPPGRIIEQFLPEASFEIVLSPLIADEVLRALTYPRVRKHLRSGIHPELWFEDRLLLADLTPGTLILPRVCADPDDDAILAAAIESDADFLVTGDNDLLALKQCEGVRILAPRDFPDLIGS